MSAYSTAHGPEAAVDLVVANDRHGLETTQALIAEVCEFVDGRWVGVDVAAARYQRFLLGSPLRYDGDLRGVDLDAVDYVALVRSELEERNVEAGRPQHAGL